MKYFKLVLENFGLVVESETFIIREGRYSQTFIGNLKNTPHVFHVEATWKWWFPRRFNVEYTCYVCGEDSEYASTCIQSTFNNVMTWQDLVFLSIFIMKCFQLLRGSTFKWYF